MADKLPPKELVALGNKRILDPKVLKPFAKLRQRAMRACFSKGPRIFGDSFAIPDDKASDLLTALEAIQVEWQAELDKLIAGYGTGVTQWAAAHKQWEAAILASAPAASVVRDRFGFDILPFRINPDSSTNAGEAALGKELNGLSDQILAELAIDAKATYKASFEGKAEVTQRAVRPLKDMIAKVSGLTFLATGLNALADHMSDILGSLPKQGTIAGTHFVALSSLMLWLAQPSSVRAMFFGTGEKAATDAGSVSLGASEAVQTIVSRVKAQPWTF
jgi:hypothetical protein